MACSGLAGSELCVEADCGVPGAIEDAVGAGMHAPGVGADGAGGRQAARTTTANRSRAAKGLLRITAEGP